MDTGDDAAQRAVIREEAGVAGMSYEIRWARDSEWSPIMKMVWKTFLRFDGQDYTQEGIRNFFEFITDDDLYISFLRGEYQLMVAVERGKVIGAGSVRSGNHLSLLFVDEAYQHRGVGSAIIARLCRYLRDEAGECFMTLKAAPYAVDFYRKLGFKAVKPEEEYLGIRVTAMEKPLDIVSF